MPKKELSKEVILAAPEGATHYGENFIFPYFKMENGEVYYYVGGLCSKWVKYVDQVRGKKSLGKCVKLPTKDDWIRHRGGVPKCADKVTVVRLRDGRIRSAGEWFGGRNMHSKILWAHMGANKPGGNTDIMAYKVSD